MQKQLKQSKFRRPPNFKNTGGNDFTILPWQDYFEEESHLKIDNDTFHTYSSGNTGPVCFFLHGAGFSALSWALLSKYLQNRVECRCVSMDMRGHGKTITENDSDLSADTLAKDVQRVLREMYGDETPPVVLVGHSMGGAIATRVAHNSVVKNMVGLVVIDVVEGTAMDALSSMQNFLQKRPSTFNSVHAAIEYCRKSGQIRNMESARVSVIGQLKPIQFKQPTNQSQATSSHVSNDDVIKEEEEDDGGDDNDGGEKEDLKSVAETDKQTVKHADKQMDKPIDTQTDKHTDTHTYTWRIDLSLTQPFWKGWFEGLSKMFLNSHPPKMLLLAGVDRLDKNLTIGQMQGKFQLEVLTVCGHAVHEDCPDQVVEKLASFLLRYKLTKTKNLP